MLPEPRLAAAVGVVVGDDHDLAGEARVVGQVGDQRGGQHVDVGRGRDRPSRRCGPLALHRRLEEPRHRLHRAGIVEVPLGALAVRNAARRPPHRAPVAAAVRVAVAIPVVLARPRVLLADPRRAQQPALARNPVPAGLPLLRGPATSSPAAASPRPRPSRTTSPGTARPSVAAVAGRAAIARGPSPATPPCPPSPAAPLAPRCRRLPALRPPHRRQPARLPRIRSPTPRPRPPCPRTHRTHRTHRSRRTPLSHRTPPGRASASVLRRNHPRRMLRQRGKGGGSESPGKRKIAPLQGTGFMAVSPPIPGDKLSAPG